MEVEYIQASEVEDFVGMFAGAMDELARQSRDRGQHDIALAAGDASDALFILLDTWVRVHRDSVPYRKL